MSFLQSIIKLSCNAERGGGGEGEEGICNTTFCKRYKSSFYKRIAYKIIFTGSKGLHTKYLREAKDCIHNHIYRKQRTAYKSHRQKKHCILGLSCRKGLHTKSYLQEGKDCIQNHIYRKERTAYKIIFTGRKGLHTKSHLQEGKDCIQNHIYRNKTNAYTVDRTERAEYKII